MQVVYGWREICLMRREVDTFRVRIDSFWAVKGRIMVARLRVVLPYVWAHLSTGWFWGFEIVNGLELGRLLGRFINISCDFECLPIKWFQKLYAVFGFSDELFLTWFLTRIYRFHIRSVNVTSGSDYRILVYSKSFSLHVALSLCDSDQGKLNFLGDLLSFNSNIRHFVFLDS